MNRVLPGNRITLLRSGGEYFPALVHAIDGAEREVWLETYIYADDDVGGIVTAALVRAAKRGVIVRLLVDGWGARPASRWGTGSDAFLCVCFRGPGPENGVLETLLMCP